MVEILSQAAPGVKGLKVMGAHGSIDVTSDFGQIFQLFFAMKVRKAASGRYRGMAMSGSAPCMATSTPSVVSSEVTAGCMMDLRSAGGVGQRAGGRRNEWDGRRLGTHAIAVRQTRMMVPMCVAPRGISPPPPTRPPAPRRA
jgi:hypothetical protein